MNTIPLRTIDPAALGPDDDTWAEACLRCGSFDNFGDTMCAECDD